MSIDRIDFLANQLRGVPISDIGRKARELLKEAYLDGHKAGIEIGMHKRDALLVAIKYANARVGFSSESDYKAWQDNVASVIKGCE